MTTPFDFRNFDLDAALAAGGASPLGEGRHSVRIMRAEMRATRAGDQALVIDFAAPSGASHTEWCLLEHRSETVRAIHARKLAQVAKACGLSRLTGPQDLVGRRLVIALRPQARDPARMDLAGAEPLPAPAKPAKQQRQGDDRPAAESDDAPPF